MRLRHIERVDFRKSEMTNFDLVAKRMKLRLKKGEAALLISNRGNQLVFVYGYGAVDDEHVCLRSERLRLTSGSWNPLMLANYAGQVGLQLEGIRRFEDHYRSLHGHQR